MVFCPFEFKHLVRKVDGHRVASNDAAFAPAAGYKCRVRCHASAGCKDTGCSPHAFYVFRRGLFPYKDRLFSFGVECHGVF